MKSLARACALIALGTCTVFGQGTVAPIAQPVDPNAVDTNVAPVAQPVNPAELSPPAAATPPTGGLTVVSVASARFDEATIAYKAGQYADAIRGFTDFIRGFPQDRRVEEALFHLAESYRNLSRTKDALAAYAYQVKNFPDGPFRGNAELRRGAMLFDQGKYADAIPSLQFTADHSPGELQEAAKYLLGRADLATQKEPAGRALLQALADQQPPGKLSGAAAQALAELDDAQNRPADAVTLWQKTVSLSTDPAAQATAAARGGWSAIAANQLDVAEKLFRKALTSTGPARQVANTGLLRVLFNQKRYDEWLTIYTAEKDNLLADAQQEILYDLGHVHFSLKHWPEAVMAFDNYLRDFGTQSAAVNAAYERFLAAVQANPAQTLTEADAYLRAWPQSPYRPRVLLLEAQELAKQQKFADAVPIWEKLALEPAKADWPRREILLERARAYDALHNWAKAATSYRAFIGEDDRTDSITLLTAEARLAVCLQNDGQLLAATEAWKAVQAQAPTGSPAQQVALESLGLIYAHGGPSQASLMVATFRTLLDRFPQTKLRALAAFSVGDSFFQNRDYAGAEPYLLNARQWDSATWMQPATQRLALGAYGRKDWPKLLGYTKEYDAIAGAEKAGPLPASLFYVLAENARKTGDLATAEDAYERVTILPDAGNLLAGAWWQLGEVQSARKEWASAAASYQKYQQLKPEAKNATVVLLALGRAQLGAGTLDAAKAAAQQALLQEPEGPNSAAARMLLAEIAYAAQSYAEAARMFATLAVLFDNSKTAPQAMARAADAFEKAGDAKSAADWRDKLKTKFPQFQSTPYL